MAKGTCAVIEDGERLTNAADIQPTIVRFPVDLHARLRRAASSRQQSMNEVVNYAVEAWLEVQGEQVVPQVGELEDAHPGESRRLDPPSGTPGIAPKNAWRGHDELEEWRPVVGWEGYYEVSSRGRIGSLERIVHRTRGMDYVHPGRILKPGTCWPHGRKGPGYMFVNLSADGRQKVRRVHQLVAEAFLGVAPTEPPGQQVRHLDGTSLNNTSTNLAWGTQSDNELDKARYGVRAKKRRKTHCKNGHPFDEANTFYRKDGSQGCRTCTRERDRRRRPPKSQQAA